MSKTATLPLPFELSPAATRDENNRSDIARIREEIARAYDPNSQTLVDNPPPEIEAVYLTGTTQITFGGLDYKTDSVLDIW